MKTTKEQLIPRPLTKSIRTALLFILTASPLLLSAQGNFFDDERGGPGGRGGPGSEPEKKLLATYDQNNDGWLNQAERAAARAALKKAASTQGNQRRRGPPGRNNTENGAATAEPGLALTPADVKSYPDAGLYDAGIIHTLFLTFENDDWEIELEDFHNTDVKVPATLVVDGKTYPNVGVNFRGNSSYNMVQRGSKRSFSLKMDYIVDKQKLGGYRNLNLLNSNGDASMMRTALTREIGSLYLPMAQVNWVRVVVNGESWGLYVNQQQQDKIFLREHYNTKKGYRWKVPGSPNARGSLNDMGDDLDVYREIFELKSKEDPRAWASLMVLCKKLETVKPNQVERKLGNLLNLDGVLRFLALENVLVNSDGYWTRASDYLLYLDPDGMFHILPYDYNETLLEESGGPGGGPPQFGNMGRQNRGQSGGPPNMGGGAHEAGGPTLDPLVSAERADRPLASRLLAVPELRTRYLQYVYEIANQWLDPEVLGGMITRYDALIEPDIWDDTRQLEGYEAYCEQVSLSTKGEGIFAFATERRTFLLNHPEVKAAQAQLEAAKK